MNSTIDLSKVIFIKDESVLPRQRFVVTMKQDNGTVGDCIIRIKKPKCKPNFDLKDKEDYPSFNFTLTGGQFSTKRSYNCSQQSVTL